MYHKRTRRRRAVQGRPWNPPIQWEFNDEDRQRFSKSFWRLPHRLLEDGTWATLWRDGGHAVPTITATLCLHYFPGKRLPSVLSLRRLARLAGVDKTAAGRAWNHLRDVGLLTDVGTKPHAADGRHRTYRMNRRLYPLDKDERWGKVPAYAFYGGHIALLPTLAIRTVYLAITGTDPVRDKELLSQCVTNEGTWSDEEQAAAAVAWYRSRRPLSATKLATMTGVNRHTVVDALDLLLNPVGWHTDAEAAYLETGPADGPYGARGGRWYTATPLPVHWTPDTMNNPADVRAIRSRLRNPPATGPQLVKDVA